MTGNESGLDSSNAEPSVDMNLLFQPRVQSRWTPKWFLGRNCWKVLSGKLCIKSPSEVHYLQQPGVWAGENISVIGSTQWKNYRFEATLSILDDSIRPPEGGAILYYHFQNPRNYYSFHVCIWKRKLEVIKRVHGAWSTVAEQEFFCNKHQPYQIAVNTRSGSDSFQINGETHLEIKKSDIMHGCVGIGVKYCNVSYSRVTIAFSSNDRIF